MSEAADGAPNIVSFDAEPDSVAAGGQVTLSWEVAGEFGSLSIEGSE